jgi:hypothetical protein
MSGARKGESGMYYKLLQLPLNFRELFCPRLIYMPSLQTPGYGNKRELITT